MNILHVTDLRFNQRWYDWLLHSAPPHDLLAIAGNLLDFSHPEPRRHQIAWVQRWMQHYPRPLCVCSGFHDLEWDQQAERWMPAYWMREPDRTDLWTDGRRMEAEGFTLLPIGCTTQPKGEPADIWLAHTPPSGTDTAHRRTGGDAGDPHLAASARRHEPRLLLTGRVPEPFDWKDHLGATFVLNPGHNSAGAFPNHILVCTDELSARFVPGTHDAPDAHAHGQPPSLTLA